MPSPEERFDLYLAKMRQDLNHLLGIHRKTLKEAILKEYKKVKILLNDLQ